MALAAKLKQVFVEILLYLRHILGVKATAIHKTHTLLAFIVYSPVWESDMKLLLIWQIVLSAVKGRNRTF